jgi:DNA-binding FadR family transcriptional regulator
MFEVMGELEAMCSRLAARRITDAEQTELLAAHQACKAAAESDGPDAYYYANERFHFAIYDAGHNAFLAAQARQLHRKLRVYRRLQLRVRNRVASSFAEHEGVVAAILAGKAIWRPSGSAARPHPGRAVRRSRRLARGARGLTLAFVREQSHARRSVAARPSEPRALSWAGR